MPVINRQQPSFGPYGRYLLNIKERKEAPIFHDSQNLKVECGIEEVSTDFISRFDNRAWAIQRGYTTCPSCS